MKIKMYTPAQLHSNPAFSQVAAIPPEAVQIFIGGQNAVDSRGNIVGQNDIALQAEQIIKNIKIALLSAEADFSNIVKWNVYLVQGQDLQPGFEVFQSELSKLESPPLVTMVYVAALAHPDFLLEVEVLAAVIK
ncbi:MAG: RidA family protein [Spirochaetes bacterium]|nr:RidA family protein [Spirochaetota bacterium]